MPISRHYITCSFWWVFGMHLYDSGKESGKPVFKGFSEQKRCHNAPDNSWPKIKISVVCLASLRSNRKRYRIGFATWKRRRHCLSKPRIRGIRYGASNVCVWNRRYMTVSVRRGFCGTSPQQWWFLSLQHQKNGLLYAANFTLSRNILKINPALLTACARHRSKNAGFKKTEVNLSTECSFSGDNRQIGRSATSVFAAAPLALRQAIRGKIKTPPWCFS